MLLSLPDWALTLHFYPRLSYLGHILPALLLWPVDTSWPGEMGWVSAGHRWCVKTCWAFSFSCFSDHFHSTLCLPDDSLQQISGLYLYSVYVSALFFSFFKSSASLHVPFRPFLLADWNSSLQSLLEISVWPHSYQNTDETARLVPK